MFAGHPERCNRDARSSLQVPFSCLPTREQSFSNPLSATPASQRKPHGGAFPRDETDHKEAGATCCNVHCMPPSALRCLPNGAAAHASNQRGQRVDLAAAVEPLSRAWQDTSLLAPSESARRPRPRHRNRNTTLPHSHAPPPRSTSASAAAARGPRGALRRRRGLLGRSVRDVVAQLRERGRTRRRGTRPGARRRRPRYGTPARAAVRHGGQHRAQRPVRTTIRRRLRQHGRDTLRERAAPRGPPARGPQSAPRPCRSRASPRLPTPMRL